jgi:hypothetical protein
VLGRFPQPLEDRVRIDLKDAGGGANASSLRQAGQHVDDQLHRCLLAMKDGAVMFWDIPVAADAVELPPGAPTGMTISAQVVSPEPTAIGTLGVGTEMH